MARIISVKTSHGRQVKAGDFGMTPAARTWRIAAPGRGARGIFWSRPRSVLVEGAGRTENIPVRDLTRWIQAAMIGLPAVMALGWLTTFKQMPGRRSHE